MLEHRATPDGYPGLAGSFSREALQTVLTPSGVSHFSRAPSWAAMQSAASSFPPTVLVCTFVLEHELADCGRKLLHEPVVDIDPTARHKPSFHRKTGLSENTGVEPQLMDCPASLRRLPPRHGAHRPLLWPPPELFFQHKTMFHLTTSPGGFREVQHQIVLKNLGAN